MCYYNHVFHAKSLSKATLAVNDIEKFLASHLSDIEQTLSGTFEKRFAEYEKKNKQTASAPDFCAAN